MTGPDAHDRNAAIARRLAAGASRRVVAAEYGISIERVRQIAAAEVPVAIETRLHEHDLMLRRRLSRLVALRMRIDREVRSCTRQMAMIEQELDDRRIDRILGLP